MVFINRKFSVFSWKERPGVAKWLRRCVISRTVPGSIPCGVTGFSSDVFPSDRTMALESIQPLVKMSTRNILGGKGGQCVRMTTSSPTRAKCHKIGSLKLLEPSKPHRACYGTALPLRKKDQLHIREYL
jgi:hypothetical protein